MVRIVEPHQRRGNRHHAEKAVMSFQLMPAKNTTKIPAIPTSGEVPVRLLDDQNMGDRTITRPTTIRENVGGR